MQNKENEPEVECILLHEYGSHHLHLLHGVRVYMYCTGLGALSGGVSASMFGLVGLVFSTVAFVIAVPIFPPD